MTIMNGKRAILIYILFGSIIASILLFRGTAMGMELESLSVAEEAFRTHSFLHLTHHGEHYTLFPISAWMMILSKALGLPHSLLPGILSILSSIGILELSRRRLNNSSLNQQEQTTVFIIETLIYALLTILYAFVSHLFLSFLLLLFTHFVLKGKTGKAKLIVLVTCSILVLSLVFLCGGGLLVCVIPWSLLFMGRKRHLSAIYPTWNALAISAILCGIVLVCSLFFRHFGFVQFLARFTRDRFDVLLMLCLLLGLGIVLILFFSVILYLLRKDKNAHRSVFITACGFACLLLYAIVFIRFFQPMWSYDTIGCKAQQLIKEYNTYRCYACGIEQAEDLDVYTNAPIMLIQNTEDLLAVNPNSIIFFTKEKEEMLSAFLYKKRWESAGKANVFYLK